jgi:putative DNA primase/helicase
MIVRQKTLDAARGKWRGILLMLGVDEKYLHNRHGPCPLCGGTDRFRFDNRDGSGSYLCSGCGSGTGMQLLQKLKGWDFKQAADEIDKVLGNVRADPPARPKLDPAKRKELMNALWKGARPLQPGDPAHRYLTERRRLPLPPGAGADLRFHPGASIPDSLGGGTAPALLALVRDVAGKPVSIHRTFLGDDWHRGRALFAGELPESVAIRLGAPVDGVLGIAEGLETALKARALFGVTCWSVVNSVMLAKFEPPEGVTEIRIYGDNDANFTGQAAAYHCAKRMVAKGVSVEVSISPEMGKDWADECG